MYADWDSRFKCACKGLVVQNLAYQPALTSIVSCVYEESPSAIAIIGPKRRNAAAITIRNRNAFAFAENAGLFAA